MPPKVSIVVPVYNVEMYLPQCLGSLTGQTLEEIQIICVDDGSVDGSVDILAEFSKRDDRVSIIHKKNGGLSSARNLGMAAAVGDFVGFVDSDDWVSPEMFERLYVKAIKYDAEIAMCGLCQFDSETGTVLPADPYYDLEVLQAYVDKSFNLTDTKDVLFRLCVTSVNKIYRSDLIKRVKPQFPEGLIFEDVPFFFDTYLNSRAAVAVRENLYHYRRNRVGATTAPNNEKFAQIIDIQNVVEEVFARSGVERQFAMQLLEYKIMNLVHTMNRFESGRRESYFDKMKGEFGRMGLEHHILSKLPQYVAINYLAVLRLGRFSDEAFERAKKEVAIDLAHQQSFHLRLFKKVFRYLGLGGQPS